MRGVAINQETLVIPLPKIGLLSMIQSVAGYSESYRL